MNLFDKAVLPIYYGHDNISILNVYFTLDKDEITIINLRGHTISGNLNPKAIFIVKLVIYILPA